MPTGSTFCVSDFMVPGPRNLRTRHAQNPARLDWHDTTCRSQTGLPKQKNLDSGGLGEPFLESPKPPHVSQLHTLLSATSLFQLGRVCFDLFANAFPWWVCFLTWKTCPKKNPEKLFLKSLIKILCRNMKWQSLSPSLPPRYSGSYVKFTFSF